MPACLLDMVTGGNSKCGLVDEGGTVTEEQKVVPALPTRTQRHIVSSCLGGWLALAAIGRHQGNLGKEQRLLKPPGALRP